jgi:quinol monooxygenase YgiN
MDKDTLYFLKISGNVSAGKHREFQQTVQFIFNHLPSGCLGRNLALDVHHANLYHIYSLWDSESALEAFKNSNEFELMRGAFQTLGAYEETMAGKLAETQLFELNYLDA